MDRQKLILNPFLHVVNQHSSSNTISFALLTFLRPHTLSLSLRGEVWGPERSSISELLEPEDDTLIWSAWVFLRQLSLAARNLPTQT